METVELTLYLTTFMAGSTVHYLKAARRDKNFSTWHGETVKNEYCIASGTYSLFVASLWYCIYTLQYSAKKQNVQLHKYKIRSPRFNGQNIESYTKMLWWIQQKREKKNQNTMSIKLKLAPSLVSTNRLVTFLLHSRWKKGEKKSKKAWEIVIPLHTFKWFQ